MFPSDLPPSLHETVSCSVMAAARYGIPPSIMLAVADKEAGAPGLWKKNGNGTSDIGPMQLNTAYLATLAKYGITPEAAAAPGCYPYDLAAWRLRRHLQLDQGDVWTRAANYHSRTPRHNAAYRLDLIARSARWTTWLEHCTSGYCAGGAIAPQYRATGKSAPAVPPGRQLQVTSSPGYVPRKITAAPTP